ncbi:MAG: hypothetical protein ABSB42_20490 [Tepidisphaeraceae bacterium]
MNEEYERECQQLDDTAPRFATWQNRTGKRCLRTAVRCGVTPRTTRAD